MKKNNIYSSLLVFLSAIITLSLITYNNSDTSCINFQSNQNCIKNILGFFGAHLSGLLFFIFGLASYLLVFFFLYFSYILFSNKSYNKEWDRIFGFTLLISASTLLLSLLDKSLNFNKGGILGIYQRVFLESIFDKTLLYVISCSFIFSSILLITRLSFVSIAHYIACSINYLIKKRVIIHIYNYSIQTLMLLLKPIKIFLSWIYDLINGSSVKNAQDSLFEFEMEDFLIDETDISQDAFWKNFNKQSSFDDESLNCDKIIEKQDDQIKFISSEKSDDFKDIKDYSLPSLDIFTEVEDAKADDEFLKSLEQQAIVLEEKLQRFGVYGKVVSIEYGPVITLFEYQPNIDSKISKILALEDDLALALEANSIRVIAPIPGKSVVGFEVANKKRKPVLFSSVIRSNSFTKFNGALPLILGEDTLGNKVVVNLVSMPHLLIAGSTGSGKSVALNTMLISLLCHSNPDELKLILIDPKRLEFAPYSDIAHLLFPIITLPKYAIGVLKWVVGEMERRYEHMAQEGVKNIFDFHEKYKKNGKELMPFIVVVIDELADLMMTAGKEVEDLITRIAQMARASGIHMIVATQRPSVDVITGLIKVNFPSRISFRVSSKADSRTILDCSGAEKLLGKGDMLFLDSQASTLKRVHGAYVSDDEIIKVVEHIRSKREPEYIDLSEALAADKQGQIEIDEDEIYEDVLCFLKEVNEVSISLLQRRFRIGYNRSARIIDMLESQGYILPSDSGKTRKVIKHEQ